MEEIVKITGRLQLRDGEKATVIVDKAESLNDEKTENDGPPVKAKEEKEYLWLVLRGEAAKNKEELLDILTTYPGDVGVYFKIDGKNYKASQSVRKCRGLVNELLSLLEEEDIKFFKA